MQEPQQPRVLVLGIGNILWADEGFGVRAVEAFHRDFEMPANVTVLDGGTQGLYLVDFVQEARPAAGVRRHRLRARARHAEDWCATTRCRNSPAPRR